MSRRKRDECVTNLSVIPALAEMFGISYGIYRPVIEFTVMLLFEACEFVIAVLYVIKTKDVSFLNL